MGRHLKVLEGEEGRREERKKGKKYIKKKGVLNKVFSEKEECEEENLLSVTPLHSLHEVFRLKCTQIPLPLHSIIIRYISEKITPSIVHVCAVERGGKGGDIPVVASCRSDIN